MKTRDQKIIKKIEASYKKFIQKARLESWEKNGFIQFKIARNMEPWGMVIHRICVFYFFVNLKYLRKCPKLIDTVIGHEIAHIKTIMKGNLKQHGKVWQKECLKLGILPLTAIPEP